MAPKRITLDSPDTRLGQLQRGQGRGYLAVRKAKDIDALLHCIHHDPRWHPYTQRYELFYAHLALDLNVDAGAVASHFDDEEPALNLTANVLGEMGLRGATSAFDELRSAFRTPNWRAAVQTLNLVQGDHPAPLVDKTDLEVLLEYEGLEKLVWTDDVRSMWLSIEPRLARLIPEPPPWQAPVRPATAKGHGPEPDRQALEAALRRVIETGELHSVAEVADALGVIGSPESSKLLTDSFECVDYSTARHPLLVALHECDPAAALQRATNALYDSDYDTRAWATRHAPQSARAAKRLQQLADDAWEFGIAGDVRKRLAEWNAKQGLESKLQE